MTLQTADEMIDPNARHRIPMRQSSSGPRRDRCWTTAITRAAGCSYNTTLVHDQRASAAFCTFDWLITAWSGC